MIGLVAFYQNKREMGNNYQKKSQEFVVVAVVAAAAIAESLKSKRSFILFSVFNLFGSHLKKPYASLRG